MLLSLIVTTYDRPDALACVLESLCGQSVAPDELIVADDGSGPATRELIDRFRRRLPYRVEHCRQEHDGFRLCRARNLAIGQTRGDYLIQLDGDMLLHPHFIADHRAAARPGYFVQGTRILLSAERSAAVLRGEPPVLRPWSRGLSGLRRSYAARLPWLSRRVRTLGNHVIAIKGCNQSFWRRDLEAVNGYNEEMVGWGPEDKELVARLRHSGVRRHSLLFAGIAYHLHHPPAARARQTANRQILAATLRERRIRCARGLSDHLAPPNGTAVV